MRGLVSSVSDGGRALFATLLLAGLPPATHARAQLALSGAPTMQAPPTGTGPLRWPDVAYDSDHDVYLAVSGAGLVAGYWLAGDGTPLDVPFGVADVGTFGQAPRVTYARGVGFVVTWHETLADGSVRIRGRVVPFGGAMGATFDVSPPGTNWEMGAALAWSSASDEVLVAWQSTADTRIGAQRVSATGALLGTPIVVDARAYYFRDPAVAYHAATDTFFVAYAGCVGMNDCFVDVQRVRAGTGELLGGPIELEASLAAGYVPELAYAASTEEVLAVWWAIGASGGVFDARTIDGAGTASPIQLVTSAFGSYDASSLAHADVSGTFVFVSHGTAAQDVALELSAAGAPIGPALPFGLASAGGNFNPRIAARAGQAEWIAVTSTDFATLTAQRFATATRDPAAMPDAAATPLDAAALDASPSPDAATTLDAGARLDAGRPRGVASGCGCRAGRARARSSVGMIGVLLLALATRRRAG